MNAQYLAALEVLKSTFSSGNEAEVILDAVVGSPLPTSLTLLDIGTGLGRSLMDLVSGLRRSGYEVRATAIDVFFSDEVSTRLREHGIEIQEFDFLQYSPSEPFNLITATQSLYYLKPLQAAIDRMCAFAAVPGLLAITVWSDDCVLRRVSKAAFAGSADVLSVADVCQLLQNKDAITHLRLVETSGPVATHQWLASRATVQAIASILSRQAAASAGPTAIEHLERIARELRPTESRKNTVIFGYANPQNVDR